MQKKTWIREENLESFLELSVARVFFSSQIEASCSVNNISCVNKLVKSREKGEKLK